MPAAAASDTVEVDYETFGSPTDPPVLLIAGFGAQGISWADGFCDLLASGGHFVIRFDNRDTGRSTGFTDHPLALEEVVAAAMAGDTDRVRQLAPYDLSAMAADAVGLLDALGIARAHVVGASLGGMIAQLVAIEHPERTRSLVSIMSATGEPEYGQSSDEAMAALMSPAPTSEADFVAQQVTSSRVWSSRRHFDPAAAATLAKASFRRGIVPGGTARQLAAMLATGTTAPGLAQLATPTLVIHGRDDTLISPSGGERTAALIAGATLLLVDDMGHDRPAPLWPLLCDAISDHIAMAG